MFIYHQASGVLEGDDGSIGVGYSGAPAGRNIPGRQNIPCVGPIPRGLYTIGKPFDSETHGPHAMHLTPDASNEMFGRAGFLIHGDSLEHPGCASEGCIVMPRAVREEISASGDDRITVVA